MAVEIPSTGLQMALDALTRTAEGYVERAQTNRMQSEARKEEMALQLEAHKKKKEMDYNYNRLLEMDSNDVVYKNGKVDMQASISNSANTDRWIDNGKNTALWTHSYFADLDVDTITGDVTTYDVTSKKFSDVELDKDDRGFANMWGTDNLSDFEVNALVHYGLLHEGDVELDLNGNMDDITATVRSRWQDPEDKAELVEVLKRRWDLTKEGIRESNPAFQTEEQYIKHANDRLDYLQNQVKRLKEDPAVEAARTTMNNISAALGEEDLQVLGRQFRTTDDGKVQWYDAKGKKISKEEFQKTYELSYKMLSSPQPVEAFARAYYSSADPDQFLRSFKEESPELFNTLMESQDEFERYAHYLNAVSTLSQSALQRTTVNVGDKYSKDDVIKSLNSNFIYNNSNLTPEEVDSKAGMAASVEIPKDFITGNLDILNEENADDMLDFYKEKVVQEAFTKDDWKENIYLLEINNESYAEEMGPSITIEEIFTILDANNDSGENFQEYENYKMTLTKNEKDAIKTFTTKNPGLYSKQSVSERKASYEQSLRALGELINVRNAAGEELVKVQSEIDGLIGVFNDGSASLKINAVQHIRTTEGQHIEETLDELILRRNALVQSITGSPDARREVGDFGVRTAKDLLLGDTPGMESIYAGESPIVNSLLGRDASDSILRGRSLPVDFMSKDSYLPVKTGRRTMIGAKGYTEVGGEVMPLSSISSDIDPTLGVGDNLVRLQRLADQGNEQAIAILEAEENRRILQSMTSEDIGALPDLYQSDAVLELIDDVFGYKKKSPIIDSGAVVETISKFEKGDRATRHNNPGAIIYTEDLANEAAKLGIIMEKGDPFFDKKDQRTYYTARLGSKEQGMALLEHFVNTRANDPRYNNFATIGDIRLFVSDYTGQPIDSTIVENYANDIFVKMR